MILSTSIYEKTTLDTSAVTQSELNIANKVRRNPLPWNGQFSPQLIQVLLREYASPGMTVFDPFLGSGTLLLEAGSMGLAASGTEINPAAIALAQTYTWINVPPEQRRQQLNYLQQRLGMEFPRNLPLFQDTREIDDPDTLKARLVALRHALAGGPACQLLDNLITRLDFYQPDLSTQKIFIIFDKLAELVQTLPYSAQNIAVYHADARRTPLPDGGVNLMITSPPYINVLNYHQQYRASMEALDWDLLKVARSEIGANRKHRCNRFLTVIQYCLDMAQTFREIARICAPQARVIFIVGRESTVRGARIFNGEIVAELAHRALGFSLCLRQERVFLNRFGQNIFEDILHFTLPDPALNTGDLASARCIARQVLEATYSDAPAAAKSDLAAAITQVDTLSPSPLFAPSKTL